MINEPDPQTVDGLGDRFPRDRFPPETLQNVATIAAMFFHDDPEKKALLEANVLCLLLTEISTGRLTANW